MSHWNKRAVIVAVVLIAVVAGIVVVRQRTSPSARQPQAPVQTQSPAATPAEAVLPAGAPAGMESPEPELLSEEEREAIDQDIVHRAQITPTALLEVGLPAQPFEAWLKQAVGTRGNIEWEANDCGEQNGSGRQTSIPVCGEATVKFRDGRQFVASVVVGSLAVRDPAATPEWSDKPSLWWTWLSFGGPNNGCSINLAALSQWLAVPANQISAKCKGKTP